MNEGNVVDTRTEMRNKIADPFAALAVLFPLPRALHYRAWVTLKQFHFAAGIKLFAASFDKFRFVIKSIALAGGARHKQLDDSPGFSWMVQSAVQFRTRCGSVSEQSLLREQMDHRDAAQPAAKPPKKFAPVN